MKRVLFFLLTVWIALLPWHAFLKTWLSSLFLGSNADFLPWSSNLLSLWKEILLVGILVVFIWLQRKQYKQLFRNKLVYLVIAYFICLMLFGLWHTPSLNAFILGIRTDVLFLPALFLGLLAANNFTKEEIYKVVEISVISLGISFSIFLLFWIIKPDIGLLFGYSPYQSSYVENKPLPLYLCIFIHEQCIPRLQASFSGPNQAGSLAILFGGLLWYWRQSIAWLLLPFGALLLSFSRSALVGSIIVFFTQIPRKWLSYSIALLALIGVSALIFIPDTLTHGLSSVEHWDKTINGIQFIVHNPLGTGLGSVGPVARRVFGESAALISENWYFQIGEEGGVLSMILLLALTAVIIYRLLSSKNKLSQTMGVVLLATSIQALFLHLWEDSVVTMLIWFWVGIGLCYNTIDSTKTYGK